MVRVTMRRTFGRSVALGGIAVFAACLMMELMLRALGVSYPNFHRFDLELGASLRPHAEARWRREGDAEIRINSAGFRDREHSSTKPPGTLRVAVLGDSFAEAVQVPMDQTFWSVMEGELHGCPALAGRTPEVLNFGVSGYGTGQEFLLLRQRVWAYDPDLVVLTLFTGNDIRNNSKALEGGGRKPYFLLDGEALTLDASFKEKWSFRVRQSPPMEWLFRLSESSRVLQLVGEAWRLIQAGAARPSSISVVHAGDGGPEQGDADRALQEAGLDAMIYRPPSDPSWTEAWAITERLLLAMQDEVNAHGAKFLLVTLTNGPQVDPRPGVRLAVQQQVGMPDLLYPDDRIRIFSARHGIPVLTLVPFFQAYAEARGVFLHGFANSGLGRGHWNGTGHRLAGELLAREVCGQIFSRHAGPDHPQSTLGPRDSRS